MNLKLLSFVFFLFLIPNASHAAVSAEHCPKFVLPIPKMLEDLKSKLPDVPNNVSKSFQQQHRKLSFLEFYSLREKPYFFLWSLHHAIEEAVSRLNSHSKWTLPSGEPAPLMGAARVPEELSNVRNAWTEYIAYSELNKFPKREIRKITKDLRDISKFFSTYTVCLLHHEL